MQAARARAGMGDERAAAWRGEPSPASRKNGTRRRPAGALCATSRVLWGLQGGKGKGQNGNGKPFRADGAKANPRTSRLPPIKPVQSAIRYESGVECGTIRRTVSARAFSG